MVWQTIKDIFARRTTVKQQRKRATKKPTKVKSAPGSKAKKTSNQKTRQSLASKKNINPASVSSASGSLIDQQDVSVPLSTNNNSPSITQQESADQVLHTNRGTNFESPDRDTLLLLLHSFEQHHPEEATLLYQSLLQLITNHIPPLPHANADDDQRSTELHTVIQELRDVIDSLNIIRAGQPAHSAQSQTMCAPTVTTHTPWTRSALIKTAALVTLPTLAAAAAALTLTYTHPHLLPETWSTLSSRTSTSRSTPTPTAPLTWKNHIPTIIYENLETHGVEAVMWLVQTAMRSYFRRERE